MLKPIELNYEILKSYEEKVNYLETLIRDYIDNTYNVGSFGRETKLNHYFIKENYIEVYIDDYNKEQWEKRRKKTIEYKDLQLMVINNLTNQSE